MPLYKPVEEMDMEKYKPKVVCFSCNFGWGYLSEEPALASKIANWIPVVCSGKIDTNHILKAFRAGADGVLILGCLEGHCHYQDGNIQTKKKVLLLQKVLETFGIEPERVEVRFSMDPEGKSMPQLLNKMNNNLIKLGPVKMV
jgi:F420-non-reducing hydrogenase iron-sulfur subunit